MVATIAPGTYLTSSVRLLRPLGAGGMGEVWLAHHQRLDVEVAVKLIRAGWRGDDTGRARFEREAQAAARIDSPHVVRVFDYGVSDDGVPFIVMERLSGEGLDARIARGGPLPSSELADIFRQVARALAAAHALGIVHRDIKPANVFLSQLPDGVFAKVLDFGIAKEVALLARETFLAGTSGVGVTQAGTILGTPLYMSPEQLVAAHEVDPRSDVWSLGVTAYEALTGRLPFAAGSYGELYRLVSEGRRAPATQLNAALPATIERWFDGMLAPDPSRRFQSVMDAASALDLALAGRGSEAMHATVAAPDVEPVRAPPAASTSLSRPLLAPPSPSVAPTVGPTPFPGAPHAQAPRPLSGGALLVGGAGLVALSVALSAWLLRSDEPEPVVSAPPRVPLQPLRLDPPSVLARPLAEKLLKAAGGEARRALSFQVSTGAATLRTWSGGAVVRRIATLQTLEERPDNLDRDDPVFDFAAIDLDQAGRVIQQAGGDHPENVELIVLKGCSGYDCGSHLKEGTPVWCVFLKGDSRRWYDLRGQLVFETKR